MTQLHELIAVLLEKYEALDRQQTKIEKRLRTAEKTQFSLFNSLQETHNRQLLSEAVLSEFIQETTAELDRISVTIEALKARTQEVRLNGWWGWLIGKLFKVANIEQDIINRRRSSLKRQLLDLERHFLKLKERQAQYGIETPVYIEVQIEDYEAKINDVINQIESLDQND